MHLCNIKVYSVLCYIEEVYFVLGRRGGGRRVLQSAL